MKQRILLFITLNLLMISAYANCDLTRYHWGCSINMHLKPTRAAHSLVYCGDLYGYITTAQYDVLARYHRADVNMSLTLNGSYVDGPCIPYSR